MSNVAMRVPPDVDAPHRLELMMTLPEGWKPSSDLTDEQRALADASPAVAESIAA